MRHYLLGLAASSLSLIALAGSPSPAKADSHHHHHHSGWHDGRRTWNPTWYRDGWGQRGSSVPYRSYYSVPNPVYVAPYYPLYYGYVYPGYGFGYTGPNVSFSIGP